MKLKVLLFGILTALSLTGCSEKVADDHVITVTIEPQRYFAEQIAGDKYKINCVVPSGQSPETYDPTPKQMVEIGKSVAYLQIGDIGFEQVWMDKIRENNPELPVFNMSKGMKMLTEAESICTGEEEGHDHHHHAGGMDPHIWTCIEGAKTIAWNTLNALIQLDKDNTSYYWENYNVVYAEIEKTKLALQELLDPLTYRTFIIYHPALTYFANEFNLTQLSIEMDGKEPTPAQLKTLVETARKDDVKIVFIQKEFDKKNAEIIAKETGCKLVSINPLDYQWHDEMIHIAKALADGETH